MYFLIYFMALALYSFKGYFWNYHLTSPLEFTFYSLKIPLINLDFFHCDLKMIHNFYIHFKSSTINHYYQLNLHLLKFLVSYLSFKFVLLLYFPQFPTFLSDCH